MLLVADAQGLAEGQGALVDALPEFAHNGSVGAGCHNGRRRRLLRAGELVTAELQHRRLPSWREPLAAAHIAAPR